MSLPIVNTTKMPDIGDTFRTYTGYVSVLLRSLFRCSEIYLHLCSGESCFITNLDVQKTGFGDV